MATARRLVNGAQPSKIDNETSDHLHKSEVPEEIIASFLASENAEIHPDDVVNEFGDHLELYNKKGDITVYLCQQLAFEIFYRNLNRWQHVNQPFGMSTMSVPNAWDWTAAERTMARHAQVRIMDDEQLDHLYQQLEILEHTALAEMRKAFKHE